MSSINDIIFSSSSNVMDEIDSMVDEKTEDKSRASRKTEKKEVVIQGPIHIRNHQRNGKKTITTIEYLATDLDLRKICKFMRKTFNTNGTVVNDEKHGQVIQLQGDCRQKAAEFLVKHKICDKDVIHIHGT